MAAKKRYEISNPLEFEHFLHVGLENLRDASMLAQTQQAAFAEVAARRHRKLPTVPQDQIAARKKKIKMETEAKLSVPLSKHERDIYDDLLLTLESGDAERLDEILASSDFDINRFRPSSSPWTEVIRRDDDGHTIMDIAVMLNQNDCALLIQDYGGTENAQCLYSLCPLP
jgi:hypothetical protein